MLTTKCSWPSTFRIAGKYGLNDLFLRRLAERSIKDSADDDLEAQIRRSFQLIFNRDPDDEELAASIEVVKESDLSLVCRSLINSNAFAFLP